MLLFCTVIGWFGPISLFQLFYNGSKNKWPTNKWTHQLGEGREKVNEWANGSISSHSFLLNQNTLRLNSSAQNLSCQKHSKMFLFRSNSSSKIIQQIFGIPFSSNYSHFIAIILILFPTINNSQQAPQNSTSSQILETSSPFSDLVPHLATEAVEVPASILDGNTDQPLEQYFWEKVHRREDCPLNCTTNSSSTQTQQLQCWRLSGYLIPFICLPTDFDPNSPFSPNGRQGTKNWLQWILSLTNAELVILALLFLNTFVGISTCICVCARRKCLGDKF